MGGSSFVIKNVPLKAINAYHYMSINGFAFLYLSQIHVTVRFPNTYGFCNNQSLGIINNSCQNTCSLLSNIMIMWGVNDQISCFEFSF